jgi:hypothetical protein
MAPELLDTAKAALYLDKPPGTLVQWRYHGTGPAYVKVGRAVRYRRRDLDAWLDSQTVRPAGAA